MSTYYYIVCDDCKESVEGASKTASHCCHFGDSDKLLPQFIVKHSGHNIRIIDEHKRDNLGAEGNENPLRYRDYTDLTLKK